MLPDHLGFEHRAAEFYVVRIGEGKASEGKELPFSDGDSAACFDKNGELMISKGVDPWTTQPKFYFTIGGLGHMQFGGGEPTADTATVYPRIKDS